MVCRRTHQLTLVWQTESPYAEYESKPFEYVSHLIGHEAGGSVLASLKARGLAVGLSAGLGADGLGCSAFHGMFSVSVELTTAGLRAWTDVVHTIFR